MSAIPCTVAADTRRHLDRRAANEAADQQAYETLRSELLNALLAGRAMEVVGPATHRVTAAEWLMDEISTHAGLKRSLVEVLGALAQQQGPLALRAQCLLGLAAHSYADYHAADYAAAIRGDAL